MAAKFQSGSRLGNYRPSLSAWRAFGLSFDSDSYFTRGDVLEMRKNPWVLQGLRMLHAPVLGAQWKVTASDARVQDFVDRSLKRFFRNDAAKALSFFEWGSSGGEAVSKLDPAGLWQWDCLKQLHIDDMRPLELGGELWGLAVIRGVEGRGRVDLQVPSCLWFANESEFGNFYGRPRLAGAWKAWKELEGKQGGREIRRKWMLRCAFHGGMMRYPVGTTNIDGEEVENQEIAMEIVEGSESGFVMAAPSELFPETSVQKWEYIPPAAPPTPTGLLEYIDALGHEIWFGMGIPPEVIEASETGSGYSGRKVPFEAFLRSEDGVVDNLIQTFDKQWLRHAVLANFGPKAAYKVEPVSLVPADQQGMANQQAQQGAQAGGQGPPPGGGGAPPAGGNGNGGGADGGGADWQPYTGPHGGKGYKNPATGSVKYGLSSEPVRLAQPDPWRPYLGMRGPKKGQQVGWRNAVTGEVLYQQEHPGGSGVAEEPQPQRSFMEWNEVLQKQAGEPGPQLPWSGPNVAAPVHPPQPQQPQQPDKPPNVIEKAKAGLRRVLGLLDRATDVPGVKQAKRGIGKALKAVKQVQGKLWDVMERRYGRKGAWAVFAAAQAMGSNPAIFPLWFVAIPGSTLLAQIPLMGVAEGLKQGRRLVKAAVGLSGDGKELSDEQVRRLADWLLRKLAAAAAKELEPHKEALAAALKGADGDARLSQAVRLAAAHAPRGGVLVQGKFYDGGEFIPAEVMEKATEEERHRVEHGEGRRPNRKPNRPNEAVPDEGRPGLSPAESASVMYYTAGRYDLLNNPLRYGGEMSPQARYAHEHIQAAFAKVRSFARPVRAVRGMDLNDLKGFLREVKAALESGGAMTFKGYVSTSTGDEVDADFDGNVVLRITVVHGLDAMPHSDNPEERELLLNHESRFKVKGLGKEGHRHVIELEQIPPEAGRVG